MIEIKQQIKFILKHPKDTSLVLEINFRSEQDMDMWFPYLTKFEDYLIEEALDEAHKNQKK